MWIWLGLPTYHLQGTYHCYRIAAFVLTGIYNAVYTPMHCLTMSCLFPTQTLFQLVETINALVYLFKGDLE